MLLDNLFAMLGGTGTAALLLGIVAFVGYPAASFVLAPSCPIHRRMMRGR